MFSVRVWLGDVLSSIEKKRETRLQDELDTQLEYLKSIDAPHEEYGKAYEALYHNLRRGISEDASNALLMYANSFAESMIDKTGRAELETWWIQSRYFIGLIKVKLYNIID